MLFVKKFARWHKHKPTKVHPLPWFSSTRKLHQLRSDHGASSEQKGGIANYGLAVHAVKGRPLSVTSAVDSANYDALMSVIACHALSVPFLLTGRITLVMHR